MTISKTVEVFHL